MYNSIDTFSLKQSLIQARQSRRSHILAKFGLPQGRYGIFIGSIYPQKLVPLLLEAAPKIKAVLTDFQLIVVGDGESKATLQRQSKQLDYIHFLGYQGVQEKAELLSIAEVVLNPGLVGLGVFDGLLAGLPTVTCDVDFHSPEIEYLEGECGRYTAPTVVGYSAEVIKVMENVELRKRVRSLGPQISEKYSIENMAKNFVDGICKCIGK